MKKIICFITLSAILSGIIVSGCTTTHEIAEKSGAQLWGENCNRCHNSPSKDQYGSEQWEVIGMHMKVRANVTDGEEKKIIAFLKGEAM